MRYGKENKQTNKKVLGSFQSSMLVIQRVIKPTKTGIKFKINLLR